MEVTSKDEPQTTSACPEGLQVVVPNTAPAEISVLGLSGEVAARTDVAACPTAGDLRNHLAEARGFPLSAVRLFLGGAELADDHVFEPPLPEDALSVAFAAPTVTTDALMAAVKSGDHGYIQAILRVAEGDAETMEELCKCKVLNLALRCAVANHKLNCVEVLLAAGPAVQAQLFMQDVTGLTVLFVASSAGEEGCMTALLRAAVNSGNEHILHAKDRLAGRTVLHDAVRNQQVGCVRQLLNTAAALAPPTLENLLLVKDRDGCTALHRAAEWGRLDCLQTILEAAAAAGPAVQQRLLTATNKCGRYTAQEVAAAKLHVLNYPEYEEAWQLLHAAWVSSEGQPASRRGTEENGGTGGWIQKQLLVQ